MLRLAVGFLLFALLAAFFGFGGVAEYSFEGAQVLFFVFLALAILAFLGGSYRRRSYWNG
jgi:uncharacterized membrane protein YtjA (UPF0391 family)